MPSRGVTPVTDTVAGDIDADLCDQLGPHKGDVQGLAVP